MSSWSPGALAPRPAAAPLPQVLLAQLRIELVLLLRNGEQVLLNLVIPLGVLVGLTLLPVVTVPDGVERVDFFVPGVIALAVMSAAFTGLAIGTGFERQYGVLKRLGATALPRGVLLGAKGLAVLVVELLQLLLLGAVGYALGWDPQGSVLTVLAFIALGTAAFAALGLLLGGTLRGLTVLAVANLLYLLLAGVGGVAFPVSDLGAAAGLVSLLPTAALAEGLRSSLVDGELVVRHLLVLLAWAAVGGAAAARLFRWE